MKKYQCSICGYIYDDAKEKVKFEDLPDDWTCPICGSPKAVFKELKEDIKEQLDNDDSDSLTEMSNGEIAYICFNLSKACEKLYLEEEKDLFEKLAIHYMDKVDIKDGKLDDVYDMINKCDFQRAMDKAVKYNDRGAKRVLNWAQKSTQLMSAVLNSYKEKGIDYIKNTKIWVCDICGFIYIGDEAPKVCPICKVPSLKILEVK